METQLPLFVFGTLRRGERNHHYLDGRYDRVLAANLPDYAVVEELMIDHCEGKSVSGEVYFLDTNLYDVTMRHCDDLESIPPGQMCGPWYERRRVAISTEEGIITAWAYVKPTSPVAD